MESRPWQQLAVWKLLANFRQVAPLVCHHAMPRAAEKEQHETDIAVIVIIIIIITDIVIVVIIVVIVVVIIVP